MSAVTEKKSAHAGAPAATAEQPFDPMAGLFVAQSQRPENVARVNLRALTPFQRALLVIDGTVTKFIEAMTMEPVEIVRLSQENARLSEDHAWLDARAATPVIARQVLLRGKYSQALHAHAASVIVPGRLPAAVKRGLSEAGAGIGRLLLGNRLETRREVLWYGKESMGPLPFATGLPQDGHCLSRAYRIIFHGQPVMLIHERFFSQTDPIPSHS